MADDTLQKVGTMLRETNDSLKRIEPIGSEIPSINDVKAKGAAMVTELNKLGAGKPPVPKTTPVIPTKAFLHESGNALGNAMKQLDSITTVDELRLRIAALKASVAVAQGRDK